MANLYTDSKLRDIVKVSRSDGGYYEMMVICKTEPNEVWLLDKTGREPDSWGNGQTKCNSFKTALAKSVRDKITETRLLSKDECDGKSKINSFVISTIKDLIEKEPTKKYWWTSTSFNESGAYAFSKYGGTANHSKFQKYGIHPLIILNENADIEGITLPPKTIPIPAIAPTSYEYDGNSHEPTIDYKGNETNITTKKSYSNKPSAVGTYTITFTLKDTSKYNWSNNPNGATATATQKWEIKAPAFTYIDIPTAVGDSYEYNGSPQKPELTYDKSNVTVILPSAYTNVGSYTGYFRLKDKSKTKWADGSTSDIPFEWVITRRTISAVPSQKGTLTYNGNKQSPEWDNYDSEIMSIGGTTSGINTDSYFATFTLDSNHSWADGSTGAIKVEWIIKRFKLIPPKQKGILFYNNSKQTPIWDADYDITAGGETSGINAGTYYALFVCSKNYYFEPHDKDNDTKVTVGWTITRCPVAVPPVIFDKEFEYDGNEYRPTWKMDEDNIDRVLLRGDLVKTNAGNYTIIAYPADNYSWEDGSITGVPYSWKITRKSILKDPELIETILEYNGQEQFPKCVNYPQDFVSGAGLSATNAGEYTAIFTIDGNHSWSDGTYSPIRIPWKIDRKKIVRPSYYEKLVFNGHEQHPDWKGIDFDNLEELEDDDGNKLLRGKYFELSGDLSSIHAGQYTTVFNPLANYQWGGGDYEPYSANWEIDKYHYKYPFQAENRDPERPTMYNPDISEYLMYNGAEQSPTLWFGNIYNKKLETFEPKKSFTVKKTSSAVNVGDYIVELTPDDDHCWADGNSEAYDVPWKIVKKRLTLPVQDAKGLEIPSPKGEQYYTGEVIYPEFNNYDPDVLEISGETSAVDIGDHIVYFEIRDKNNYEWADGRTGRVPVIWSIIAAPIRVEHPSQRDFLVYNGEYQSPEWRYYDPKAMMLIGSKPREKYVGKYSVKFALKKGYAWMDGTTENTDAFWYIHKIEAEKPCVHGTDKEGNNGQFIEIDGKYYPVWDNYNPNIMTMSGDTYAVDDSVHITIFTLKRPDIYRWANKFEWDKVASEPHEVRWRVNTLYDPETGGGTWNPENVNPVIPGDEEPVIPEVVMRLPGDAQRPLPDDNPAVPDEPIDIPGVIDIPPEDIPRIITDGIPGDEWHIGDEFPIELNGIVGGVEFKHAWFFVYIIGFDHNSGIEGKKTVHFQFAKRWDNKQEIAFTDKHYGLSDKGKGFCMNKSDSSEGGWKSSYMRTLCRQLYYAMPKAWRDIIIPCPKYTNNGQTSVTLTRDKIFLLSEFECTGKTTSSDPAEADYQEQYKYYKLNGFKGKYKYNSTDETVESWLRSPCVGSTDSFCAVNSSANLSGECAGRPASSSLGLAPCFAVGESGSAGTGGKYDPDDPDDPGEPSTAVGGTGEYRVHIPQQVKPPYEDGSIKNPKWDEYNGTAIINLGGEWDGVSAGTYHVILKLRDGYIWEDGTKEIKTVPWRILVVGEPAPTEPAPIRVHIPEQIDPPCFDGNVKTSTWDEWNYNAIKIIGGNSRGVIAETYYLKVELLPGYVWEDGTVENKRLPWRILPRGSVITNDEPGKYEVIEQSRPQPDKSSDNDPSDNTSDSRFDYHTNYCCGCETGLFDKLNNFDCDDGVAQHARYDS